MERYLTVRQLIVRIPRERDINYNYIVKNLQFLYISENNNKVREKKGLILISRSCNWTHDNVTNKSLYYKNNKYLFIQQRVLNITL